MLIPELQLTKPALPRLPVPSEHIERWRDAAKAEDIEFDQWIVDALNRVAMETLGVPG